jgi:triacylglycerol lipase
VRVFILLTMAFICGMACNQSKKETEPHTAVPAYIPQPPADSVVACLLSQIAYCDNPGEALKTHLPHWKMVFSPTSINGNYAFVATNDTCYAIAIRGSLMRFGWDAFQNWVYQDMNALKQKRWTYTDSTPSGVYVSAGSLEGLDNLLRLSDTNSGRSLVGFFEQSTTAQTPILVTGHSLGGHLATVYASWLWWHFNKHKQTRSNMNVISFAAPAAGDKEFATRFNKIFPLAQRFVMKGDMVPRFPDHRGIAELGDLYKPGPDASKIEITYKGVSVSMAQGFTLAAKALQFGGLLSGINNYEQVGKQHLLNTAPYDNDTLHTASRWFAEAAYQHGVKQYAQAIGAAQVDCKGN